MCERRVSIAVNHDGVEGVCGGHEVLLIGLLTRPGLDRDQSCEQVNGPFVHVWYLNGLLIYP